MLARLLEENLQPVSCRLPVSSMHSTYFS